MKADCPCILQVEDDEHDVFFLRYAFKHAGVTNPVHVATEGEQAIAYLAGTGPFADRRQYPLPSLMLLDLKLPRVSGLDVLKWLREQPALSSIIVVVFTSSCDPADIENSYKLGANSFAVKPVDLVERIEFARSLKAWWLECCRFARLPDRALPIIAPCFPDLRAPRRLVQPTVN